MAERPELSYIYGRVCGAMKRSWAGERAAELARFQRLSDLWRAVFHDAPPVLPETLLVSEMEARVVKYCLSEFVELAGQSAAEEPFFLALRRKSEFARVKRVLLALRDREPDCPASEDGRLTEGFDAAAYPRIDAMFRRGRYAWITQETLSDLPGAENRLDRQYYQELWAALKSVPAGLREGLEQLLVREVELENVVWALRLVRYYSMRPEVVEELLVKLPGADATSAALKAAALRQDRRGDWQGWKYDALVDGGGEGWSFDVPAFETATRRLLYRRMRLALHVNPFSYTPLYCFFKLKEIEAAVLLGIVEGVHLGVPADEMTAFAMTGGVH